MDWNCEMRTKTDATPVIHYFSNPVASLSEVTGLKNKARQAASFNTNIFFLFQIMGATI